MIFFTKYGSKLEKNFSVFSLIMLIEKTFFLNKKEDEIIEFKLKMIFPKIYENKRHLNIV